MVIAFCVFPFLFALHIFLATDLSKSFKVKTILACCILAAIPITTWKVYRDFLWSNVPAPLLALQGASVCCVLLLAIAMILYDIAYVVQKFKCFQKTKYSPARRKFLTTAGYIAVSGVTATGFSCTGVQNGFAVPEIHVMEKEIANLPRKLDGLRICYVSDIHVGPITTRDWLDRTIARIIAARPDCICLGGDLSDGKPYTITDGIPRAELFMRLKNLSAPCGIFTCIGNHEYYGDYLTWMKVYKEAGITVLHNTWKELNYNGTPFTVLGRDDIQIGTNKTAKELFASMPKNQLSILLDHRPVRAEENAQVADLLLSGHTHGGQIIGLNRVVAKANKGYVSGWYTVAGKDLYVSTGAGLWAGFPVRLGVPAEIAIIDLGCPSIEAGSI